MRGINKYKKLDLNLEFIKKEYNSGKSSLDLAKIFDVDYHTILTRLRKINVKIRKKLTEEHKKKISNTLKRKGIKPKERYSGEPWNKNKKGVQVAWNKGLIGVQDSIKKGKTFEEFYGKEKAEEIRNLIKEKRKYQVLPKKDSSIEVKIQNYLKQLNIDFFTHQYMKIEHGYQCDILIPYLNLVIECDGDYWHKYPIGRDIDHIRTKELIEKGFKVLRIWEFEINKMSVDDFKEKIYG